VADKRKGCSLLKPLLCHPDGLQLARIVFTSQIFHKLTCSVLSQLHKLWITMTRPIDNVLASRFSSRGKTGSA
jgi:hypothetical protein